MGGWGGSGARRASGLGQLFRVSDDCAGVNWSVLVLGCRRRWGTVSKFSQMPGPWLKAWAVGEGKPGAQEGFQGLSTIKNVQWGGKV